MMTSQPVTVNHHRAVWLKDGREFVHECNGLDCQIEREAVEQGFPPSTVDWDDIGAWVEWKSRT